MASPLRIVALTAAHTTARHLIHIETLEQMGHEVICVGFRGPLVTLDKMRRQARIIWRRGPTHYLRWRTNNQCAISYHEEVREYLSKTGMHVEGGALCLWRSFPGFTAGAARVIKGLKPDFVFQLGAGLLPPSFVRHLPNVLNLHPGILPGIRGVDPIFWSHYYGREDWCGSTLHIIDEGIDTGRPLLRMRFQPEKNHHYAESLRRQILIEQDMIRIFFDNQPIDYLRFDQGGCEKSVYRSQWSLAERLELERAGWWAARELSISPRQQKAGKPRVAAVS